MRFLQESQVVSYQLGEKWRNFVNSSQPVTDVAVVVRFLQLKLKGRCLLAYWITVLHVRTVVKLSVTRTHGLCLSLSSCLTHDQWYQGRCASYESSGGACG